MIHTFYCNVCKTRYEAEIEDIKKTSRAFMAYGTHGKCGGRKQILVKKTLYRAWRNGEK